MKTKKFAPRDAKLLREYPDSTLDELRKLGLSKKAYERLISEPVFPTTNNTIQPVKVEHTVKQPLSATVRMSNMRTGRIVRIGYKAATLLSTKYPDEFKILNQ